MTPKSPDPKDDSAAPSDRGRGSGLALPLAGGEPLADYFQRAIFTEPVFLSLFERCKVTGVTVGLYPEFRPAVFKTELVTAFHNAVENINLSTPFQGHWWAFDSLWVVEQLTDPAFFSQFISRYSTRPLTAAKRSSWPMMSSEQSSILCAAARQRDTLMLRICDALRSGAIAAHGFLISDHDRTLLPVNAGWWSDPTIECGWHAGELRPRLWPGVKAPSGTPHYRGVHLTSGAMAKVAAGALPKALTSRSRPGRRTRMAIERWHKAFFESLSADGSMPSVAVTWAAARQKFEGKPGFEDVRITRALIEKLREPYRPPGGFKMGPKPK